MSELIVSDVIRSAKSDSDAIAKLLIVRRGKSGVIRDEEDQLEEDQAEEDRDGPSLASRITKLFGMSDSWYIQRQINPSAQYQYAYVLLDTDNSAAELSSDTRFGWHISNTSALSVGTVNVPNNIRNLVGMRIFPVTMQLIAPVGETTKTYINNVSNINNNFSILIHEFASQSYVGREGRKFHFALFPALMNMIVLSKGPGITPANPYFEFTTSGKSNGWFWFQTPIVEFNTMTISIGNPFDLVRPGANNTRTLIPIQLIYLAEKEEMN